MQVLVTGGAGFVGSHLVELLIARGYAVRVLDDLSRGRTQNLSGTGANADFRFGDVRSFSEVRAATEGCTLVYHLAARSTVIESQSRQSLTFAVNGRGTLNVLKAAELCNVGRVVVTSSREVYGEGPIVVPESAPLNAKNAYGRSKRKAEAYCAVFTRRGMDVSVVRLTNVYGLRDFGRVIPNFIRCALADEPLTVYGGSQVLDFIDVGSVTEALFRVGTGPYVADPINIGSGKGLTIREVAAAVLDVTKSNSPVVHAAVRDIEVQHFVADIRKAMRLIDFRPPEYPLCHLPDMVEHMRRRPSTQTASFGY